MMQNVKVKLSQLVHEIRLAKGMTRKEVGNRAGCSPETIRRVELDIGTITDTTINGLAEAFNVSPDYLRVYNGNGEPAPVGDESDYIKAHPLFKDLEDRIIEVNLKDDDLRRLITHVEMIAIGVSLD